MDIPTKHQASPIEKIRNLVENSTDPLLDKSPVHENDIFEILWMLVGSNVEKKLCADIPIWAIGSFTHLNFANASTSWRNLLYPSLDGKKDGVTGAGWTNQVFDYFSAPLEDNWFPAESSTQELRLHAYGNFISVTNGVHRAVGAVNYLAAIQGSRTAVLQKAMLTYQEIDQELLTFLKSKSGTEIYFSWVEDRNRAAGIRIISATKFGAVIYYYKDRKISTKQWIPLPNWALPYLTKARLLNKWHNVKQEYLYILLQKKWLQDISV
ncbi:hypothetical protein HQN60_01220 [Deefgea piscis]|uniref:Uncharacterized protein n=1 Tax=Deefgea piscis TaxID=2739061 RepID=A0A6M8SMT2_9NEIS|nr:hypothetical protein [Deefgea piscis]QKJ65464.1 hypothetical protein HQN60_01220 [Deefgea piscis]